jgi:predicted regulator of Ras-like GTPase activity (Roadblock/LC7/MglB family)
MDAAQALADLTEISSQIEAAVLFDESGAVLAATLPDDAQARAVAAAAAALLSQAAVHGEVTQLEASVQDGSVFVVRDGARRIAAVTGPAPTVGLVFYDLKSALRGAAEEKPKRRRTTKKADDAA